MIEEGLGHSGMIALIYWLKHLQGRCGLIRYPYGHRTGLAIFSRDQLSVAFTRQHFEQAVAAGVSI